MASGIALAQHYQGEALRLFEAGFTDPDLMLAEKVVAFIRQRGGVVKRAVRLRTMDRMPLAIARPRYRVIDILENAPMDLSHRWRHRDRGAPVRDAWRLRG